MDLWAEGGKAVITANEDAADAIKLHAELLNLDFYTTDHLLKGLSQCTGFDIYLITSLTTQIYSPMLIDHFNRSDNTLYNHYVEQFRLFEKKKGSIQSGLTDWIPWLSTNETFIYYGCRICLQHDTAPFIRLYWRLKWLTSCPYHKILLQPVRFYNKSSKRIGFYFFFLQSKFSRTINTSNSKTNSIK